MVANFIPPAYDLANLFPKHINFRRGGLITAIIAFFVGALWLSLISQVGVVGFVNIIGAIIAPFFGILVVDYYLIKHQELDIQALFDESATGKYYYQNGWNIKGVVAFVLAGIVSIIIALTPSLTVLEGFGFIIGAFLGGFVYWLLMRNK